MTVRFSIFRAARHSLLAKLALDSRRACAEGACGHGYRLQAAAQRAGLAAIAGPQPRPRRS